MNLLQETIEDIICNGHKVEDIIFIGSESSGYSCTWPEYKVLANHDYDDGFGAQKVASDLIIVFASGAKMLRSEYDGSEEWQYSSPFKMPAEMKPIKKLFANGVGWEDLADINSVSE